MSTKHTPGPWIVSPENPNVVRPLHCRDSIAVTRTRAGIVEAEANAQLIAAAPDLLARAVDLLEYLENWHPIEGAPFHSSAAIGLNAAVIRARG